MLLIHSWLKPDEVTLKKHIQPQLKSKEVMLRKLREPRVMPKKVVLKKLPSHIKDETQESEDSHSTSSDIEVEETHIEKAINYIYFLFL